MSMQTTDITTKDFDINVYFGDIKYRDAPRKDAYGHVKYLYTDLTDIRKYYIRLGFHLDEFERKGYYFDFGYSTLADFCMVNLGLDKSAVSRCICVYREFNAANVLDVNKGSAMELAEEWNEYSYTQLCEMLPLSPHERKAVTPDMTIKQIREYKKKLKDDQKRSEDTIKFLDGVVRSIKNPVASTQPEESGSGSVASTQPKKFNYDECFKKSGIVQQNYIKSCDYDQKEGMPAVYLYDCHGKRIMFGHCGCVLERVNNSNENRIVIRMTGYCYDPVELKEN